MIKKWIALPVAALALMSLGAPIANQSTVGVHASEAHHESFDEYMAKRVTFFNNKQSFHIHGRVTPVQLNRYLRDQDINIDKATCLIYGNGQAIDLVKDTPTRPLWQYCTLKTMNAQGKDVKSGQDSNNTNNEIWLDGNMKPSASVHMRTPMKWGYYYLSDHEVTSTLDFVCNGNVVGRSNYSLGFDVPNTPDSHYHGTFNQFLANVNKYHVDIPSGYKMIKHRPRVVKIDNYKYNNHFPDPIIRLQKIAAPSVSAPIFYGEGNRLVNAGADVKNVTPNNVGSKVKNSKLEPPTDNYSIAPNAQPVLKKNGAGQAYVEIPTNAPKPAPKKAPETNAPVEFNEGGHLVYAGKTLTNVTPSNLVSKLNGASLEAPTSGYRIDSSKKPSIEKNGNSEYVEIPTIAETKKPAVPKAKPQPAPKKPSVQVSNPAIPERMYWIRAIRYCGLYNSMNTKTGHMYNIKSMVHPHFKKRYEKLFTKRPYDTFLVSRIYDYHEPNGKSYVRYKVRLNGHWYYITGSSHFVLPAYYQPNEVRNGDTVRIKLPIEVHSTMYTGNVAYLRTGALAHISGDAKMGYHRYRFTAKQKTRKGYRTVYVVANKSYTDDISEDKRTGHVNNDLY